MSYPIFSLGGLAICIGYFFAGIVDAISGGGGLITLSTMMAVGFPVRCLVGTNQMAASFGGATSTIEFARKGHVDWTAALPAIPTAILGGILGARLNLLIPLEYLQIIMVVLIPVIAIIVIFKPEFGGEDHSGELSRRQMLLRSLLIGLFFGVYQGFYGAGSGTFFMLGFVVFTKFDLIRASGTTKVVVFASCLSGALTYAVSGTVYWPMVICAAGFNILGNYLGSGLAMTKGARLIRPMFLGILALLLVRLVAGLLQG